MVKGFTQNHVFFVDEIIKSRGNGDAHNGFSKKSFFVLRNNNGCFLHDFFSFSCFSMKKVREISSIGGFKNGVFKKQVKFIL